MPILRVRNWERWQSYRSDRGQPPWIKVHREVMRNQDWVSLSDAQRGQIVSIWLLAADKNGQLPEDPSMIMPLCYMDSEPDITAFINMGFLEIADAETPKRRQSDAKATPRKRRGDVPETETEAEAQTEEGKPPEKESNRIEYSNGLAVVELDDYPRYARSSGGDK